MSADFIVEYAGAPVRFTPAGAIELVPENQATPFRDESSAALAAHRAGLNRNHCRVVPLHAAATEFYEHTQN